MGPDTPTIDDKYRRYADLLLRHSRLLAERGDVDAETEAVEEEMTRLWDHLDAVQRRSLSGLGSDLNWVRRGCQLAPGSRRPEDVTPQDSEAIIKARDRGDWHGVLHYLRLCSSTTPPSLLARLRARAWRAMDFPRLASLFFDLAAKIEPGSGPMACAALDTAAQVDPPGALERARTILADPLQHPTAVVALAVKMLLLADEENGPRLEPKVADELLRGCLEPLRLGTPSDTERAKIYHLVADSFHFLGSIPEARHAYEEGLRISPDDADMLVGLGLLLYGQEDVVAAGLFARAAKLQSPVDIPYFFLAHYHISRRNFVEGLTHCSQALARTISDQVRAQLLEWAAICEGELSFPDEVVKVLFRKARELDPTNVRISKNQQAFEVGGQGPAGRPYDFEPASSFKDRRAAEIRTILGRPAA